MSGIARRAFVAAFVTLAAPVAAHAQSRVTLQVTDLSPRFLTFYEAAAQADPDRRFALWKEHYGFAALPPVPEADSMARAMLDAAWPRYPEVMDRIRAGAAGMQPAPEPTLSAVADLLGVTDTITVRLLAYVGAREGNAFTNASRGLITVYVPVEEDPAWRELVMVHEMTHAVHHRLAGYSEGWERSIGRTVFAEGLAARATEALHPGRPAAAYLEHRPGWFAAAESHSADILRGILPHLRASDSPAVMRFTMGTGSTGTEREAYFAGWLVIGHLLENGYTFPQLARIPESEAPALVEAAIREMLAQAGEQEGPETAPERRW
ncbi:MAG TPA: hypothetical protein VF006_28775 [Longimicrobium sp.]